MSDNVLIALIIVAGLVLIVALWMFKDRISEFNFKASKKNGLGVNMKGSQETGVNVSGNMQSGENHEISAGANTTVTENQQLGKGNKINANKK